MNITQKIFTGLTVGVLLLTAVSCQSVTGNTGSQVSPTSQTTSVTTTADVVAANPTIDTTSTPHSAPTALATILPTLSPTEAPGAATASTGSTQPSTATATATATAATPTALPRATQAPTATPTTPASAPVSAGGNAVTQRFGGADFSRGTVSGLKITAKGLELAGTQGQSKGQFTSDEITGAIPFNNLVASWSADMPSDASLKVETRVRMGTTWSGWYTMGTWANGKGSSVSGQKDASGSVDVDTLLLTKQAQAMQYRITLSSTNAASTGAVRSVTMAYTNTSKAPTLAPPAMNSNAAKDLPVPQISQAIQDPSYRWEICSPTSLTMVLNYWGDNKSLQAVMAGVQDKATGIYGNWPLNTAYAGTQGFDAHISRFYSLADLENEIAQGRPVIVSINFKAGELSNAPISSTSGHLIVVRGFTANGDVIVNDPASPSNETVRRVYQRSQFSSVWLKSGGVAYVLQPAS